nr:ROK family protein [Bacteroidota bacterium]
MGGTKILSAALNTEDGIIARVKQPSKRGASQVDYIDILKDIIYKTIDAANLAEVDISAVSLGVPGSVNPFTGVIGLAPNLEIKNFKIKEKLEAVLPFPVLIENDVNLGALGIKYFGAGKKAKDMLVVFVGTGIGAGLIFDGKLFRGANYCAGEIGHMKVKQDGPLCGCGQRGCFEAIASRPAIVKNIKKDLRAGKKSIISKIIQPGQPIKSKALAYAVKHNDKVVTSHINNACITIGRVLASVTNMLNLDLIILGGGVIEALDSYMLPLIKEAFNKEVLKDSAKGLKIKATKLKDDAALFGGIPLVEEFLNIKL